MHSPLIVVDRLSDWAAFAQGAEVMTAADYLAGGGAQADDRRVINCSADTGYLGSGYYVSLLAEARGKRALPSVRTLLDLTGPQQSLRVPLRRGARRGAEDLPGQLTICFGRCPDARLAPVASALFQRHPAPILHAQLSYDGDAVRVSDVSIGRLDALDDATETEFAEALDHFSHRIWRTHRRRMGYDLAILVDPHEVDPPSNRKAIGCFERVARSIGFAVEVITPDDAARLLEFDALLIRCTTAIDHISYRLARQAAREGLAVIDDPDSILRCCNKVFLHDLLARHRIGMPESRLIMRDGPVDLDGLVAALGLPMVLKIPDGAFSRGVFRVDDRAALEERSTLLLAESAAIIAQAYVPTPFDWRIGVLEGRALYACRYHMARDHWQIVNHAATGERHGDHECLPLGQVPPAILRTAVKAARLIGNGLYGVDLKWVDGQALVIEVNDNPSIDAGVEDEILGEELYRQIVAHLMGVVQARGR